jgi:hypothetical protein
MGVLSGQSICPKEPEQINKNKGNTIFLAFLSSKSIIVIKVIYKTKIRNSSL